MGAWGTGLYQDDTAMEVREYYQELLKKGISNEESLDCVLEAFEEVLEDADDAPPFWFGLADTCLLYTSLPRIGSALKTVAYHAFPNVVDNYAGYATKSQISNGTLYQVLGSLNGVDGRFEWVVQNNYVTHRLFVRGGSINGRPIIP